MSQQEPHPIPPVNKNFLASITMRDYTNPGRNYLTTYRKKHHMKELLTVPEAPNADGISILPEALTIRNEFIAAANEFRAITNIETRDSAVDLVRKAKAHVSAVEKTRKELSDPFLSLQREIKSIADGHSVPIIAEVKRLEKMVGAFNEEVRQKAAAEERRRQEELRQAEMDRLKAIKAAEDAAKLVDEAKDRESRKEALRAQLAAEEKVDVAASINRQIAAAPVAQVSTAGGASRYEITVEVTDIHALYAAQSSCVKLTPDLVHIKWMHEHQPGIELPGVTITKTHVFSVRK